MLNGKGNVSQATRQMILDIARELHYRPNLNARCLKSGQSNTLGIITEDLTVFNNPEIVDGIAAAACLFDRNRDRIVCIYEGEPDAAALARAMRRLVPKYMLPNIYEKLDALPMNANGKIDRVKLKEQFIHAED